ncbi:hypothetical protein IW262DRAFT_1299479 [Armillaria fumosa]|nr:hypothetical protein IW262DRAFT_1299479 [Armillaria fumosa]
MKGDIEMVASWVLITKSECLARRESDQTRLPLYSAKLSKDARMLIAHQGQLSRDFLAGERIARALLRRVLSSALFSGSARTLVSTSTTGLGMTRVSSEDGRAPPLKAILRAHGYHGTRQRASDLTAIAALYRQTMYRESGTGNPRDHGSGIESQIHTTNRKAAKRSRTAYVQPKEKYTIVVIRGNLAYGLYSPRNMLPVLILASSTLNHMIPSTNHQETEERSWGLKWRSSYYWFVTFVMWLAQGTRLQGRCFSNGVVSFCHCRRHGLELGNERGPQSLPAGYPNYSSASNARQLVRRRVGIAIAAFHDDGKRDKWELEEILKTAPTMNAMTRSETSTSWRTDTGKPFCSVKTFVLH